MRFEGTGVPSHRFAQAGMFRITPRPQRQAKTKTRHQAVCTCLIPLTKAPTVEAQLAAQSIPAVPNPNNDVLAEFFAKLERAIDAAYPACGKCGSIIQRGQLVDTTGSEHIACPAGEPEDEMLRRLR